jgi:gamma-carbonic anhydrase
MGLHTGFTAPLFALGSLKPNVDGDAWIAPTAALIGDVHVGSYSSVWFHCTLRGDVNVIRIGARTNIQDGTVIHVDPGEMSVSIGNDVTIGHGCILHGCTLMDRAFVGMGATVLNGAIVEPCGVLAAGALLAGGKRISAGELWAGVPAKFVRRLSSEESDEFLKEAARYTERAARFKTELR